MGLLSGRVAVAVEFPQLNIARIMFVMLISFRPH